VVNLFKFNYALRNQQFGRSLIISGFFNYFWRVAVAVPTIGHRNIDAGKPHGFNIKGVAPFRKVLIPSNIEMGAIKAIRTGRFFAHDGG